MLKFGYAIFYKIEICSRMFGFLFTSCCAKEFVGVCWQDHGDISNVTIRKRIERLEVVGILQLHHT